MSSIGCWELVAEPSDSKRFKIVVRIYVPGPDPRGHWACTAEVEGMLNGFEHADRIDSLQALLLAVGLARGQLNRFEKQGGKFYLPGDELNGNGPIAVSDPFGGGA
ncbi:MAG: DUF6968 family protein [Gammaproteobacteria bacterium]